MTEQVWLTITGEQTHPDGTTEKNTSRNLAGHLIREDGTHELYFDEQIDGVEGAVPNRITISPERITIEKTGNLDTNLVLENGHLNKCRYDTGYGLIDMDITASHVALMEVNSNLHAMAKYEIKMDKDYKVKCRVIIKTEKM